MIDSADVMALTAEANDVELPGDHVNPFSDDYEEELRLFELEKQCCTLTMDEVARVRRAC